MNTPKVLLGLVGACGACCTIPLILPFLLGGGAIGSAWLGYEYGLVAAVAMVAAAIWIAVRHQRKKACNL